MGVDDQVADHADHAPLHVVEQDRRVGQDDPLNARVGDVALMPERDVLDGRRGVAAQQTREPGDLLGLDRVALVGHRARALLPGGKGLAGLAQLGPGEVADLGGEALEAGAGQCDRLDELGVAVTRHHLGRDLLDRKAEATENPPLEVGRGGGVGANRARERADRSLPEGPL